MKRLNVVIVGAGRSGGELIMRPLKSLANVNVCALCDTNIELAQKVARENNITDVYSSLEKALDRQDVQLVCISTPPESHFELAKLAMEKGCAVLVEKPFTNTLTEAEELKKIQEVTGSTITVIHNHKFMPGMVKALDIYKSGRIGDIIYIDRYWIELGRTHRLIGDPSSWVHKMRGGVCCETMPHLIYQVYQFVGEMDVKQVYAYKKNEKLPWVIADEVTVVLESLSNKLIMIKYSANATEAHRKGGLTRMIITGTKDSIHCDYHDAFILRTQDNPSLFKRGLKAVADLSKNKLSKRQISVGSGHGIFINKYIEYLTGSGENPVPIEEALHAIKLCTEIAEMIEKSVKRLV